MSHTEDEATSLKIQTRGENTYLSWKNKLGASFSLKVPKSVADAALAERGREALAPILAGLRENVAKHRKEAETHMDLAQENLLALVDEVHDEVGIPRRKPKEGAAPASEAGAERKEEEPSEP